MCSYINIFIVPFLLCSNSSHPCFFCPCCQLFPSTFVEQLMNHVVQDQLAGSNTSSKPYESLSSFFRSGIRTSGLLNSNNCLNLSTTNIKNGNTQKGTFISLSLSFSFSLASYYGKPRIVESISPSNMTNVQLWAYHCCALHGVNIRFALRTNVSRFFNPGFGNLPGRAPKDPNLKTICSTPKIWPSGDRDE